MDISLLINESDMDGSIYQKIIKMQTDGMVKQHYANLNDDVIHHHIHDML